MSFRLVFLLMEWVWSGLGLACLALAAALVLKPSWEPEDPRGRLLPIACLGVLLPALIAGFKLAQYHAFQSMYDTGLSANMAWNAARGNGLAHCSVMGDQSYFTCHFSFTMAFLAPLLRLWEDTSVLMLAYGLVIASLLPAVYLMARRLTRHPAAPWVCVLLVMSSRVFHDTVGSPMDNNGMSGALAAWTAVFWMSGLRSAAVLTGLALFTCREQAPFLTFGVGLYYLARWRLLRRRDAASAARCLMLGMLLALGSAAAWACELQVIRAAQRAWPQCEINYWTNFQALGGTQQKVLALLWSRPWELLIALVHPVGKVASAAGVLLSLGLLPLWAGAALLPAAATWLPHQLADYANCYHRLNANSGFLLLGTLAFATAKGLSSLLERLDAPARRRLCACLLVVAGTGLLRTARFQLPAGLIPAAWAQAGPRAIAAVPPGAKLWCDEFFLPHLALRRHVKVLPRSLPDTNFDTRLFLPDRVLMSSGWARLASPGVARSVLGFLSERGYAVVFREADLVVLAAPGTEADRRVPLEWVQVPAP